MTNAAALTDADLTAIFESCLAEDFITKRRSAFHNAWIQLAHMLGEGAIDEATYYASKKRMTALFFSSC